MEEKIFKSAALRVNVWGKGKDGYIRKIYLKRFKSCLKIKLFSEEISERTKTILISRNAVLNPFELTSVSLNRFTFAQELLYSTASGLCSSIPFPVKKKKNPPVNYQLDKRKSCIQIASKGNCKYLLRNKTEHNFLLCIQNWKQNKKILLNFSSHTAVKTTKLLLIKKSMLKDSKGNCSHVNGNQLQSTLVLYQSHPQTLFL